MEYKLEQSITVHILSSKKTHLETFPAFHNGLLWSRTHTTLGTENHSNTLQTAAFPCFDSHASYLKHCSGHPVSGSVCLRVLAFSLWFSLSDCVLVLHHAFPFFPPCSREALLCAPTRQSKLSYLSAALSWRSVCEYVCLIVCWREIWCACLCVCACVFRLQSDRSA